MRIYLRTRYHQETDPYTQVHTGLDKCAARIALKVGNNILIIDRLSDDGMKRRKPDALVDIMVRTSTASLNFPQNTDTLMRLVLLQDVRSGHDDGSCTLLCWIS